MWDTATNAVNTEFHPRINYAICTGQRNFSNPPGHRMTTGLYVPIHFKLCKWIHGLVSPFAIR